MSASSKISSSLLDEGGTEETGLEIELNSAISSSTEPNEITTITRADRGGMV